MTDETFFMLSCVRDSSCTMEAIVRISSIVKPSCSARLYISSVSFDFVFARKRLRAFDAPSPT